MEIFDRLVIRHKNYIQSLALTLQKLLFPVRYLRLLFTFIFHVYFAHLILQYKGKEEKSNQESNARAI